MENTRQPHERLQSVKHRAERKDTATRAVEFLMDGPREEASSTASTSITSRVSRVMWATIDGRYFRQVKEDEPITDPWEVRYYADQLTWPCDGLARVPHMRSCMAAVATEDGACQDPGGGKRIYIPAGCSWVLGTIASGGEIWSLRRCADVEGRVFCLRNDVVEVGHLDLSDGITILVDSCYVLSPARVFSGFTSVV